MKWLLLFLIPFFHVVQYPDLSGFTWIQQEGATLTQSLGKPPVLYFPNTGNKHEKMLMTSLPAPPYTVTLGVTINQTDYTKQVSATIVLRKESTDQAIIYTTENEMAVIANPAVDSCAVYAGGNIFKITGTDVDAAMERNVGTDWASWPHVPVAQRSWIRITDDGINRNYYFSVDEGHNWIILRTVPSGSFIVPDQVGIGGYTLDDANFLGFSLTIWEFSIKSTVIP